MADPFIGEIRSFPFNFAPKGWAFCNGQLLPLSQNTALFSLLGTTYGGNGQTTFGLPDLQGRTAMGQGQGPGLTDRFLGETGGATAVTLLQTEMPSHQHTVNGRTVATAGSADPTGNVLSMGTWRSGSQFGVVQAYATQAPNSAMSPTAAAPAGGSQPHNNMMPYVTLNYCIALQGVYPPRS
jgi:microcystin-dependent protein